MKSNTVAKGTGNAQSNIIMIWLVFNCLRDYCTSYPYLHVLYSISKESTPSCKITYAPSLVYSKLFKDLQNGIEILVGQAVFKLWIKLVKMLFGLITQEMFHCLNAIFEFIRKFTIRYMYFCFQKDVDNFEIGNKRC